MIGQPSPAVTATSCGLAPGRESRFTALTIISTFFFPGAVSNRGIRLAGHSFEVQNVTS